MCCVFNGVRSSSRIEMFELQKVKDQDLILDWMFDFVRGRVLISTEVLI